MRQPVLLLVMGLLLLCITSLASPELLKASAIEQESKDTGQVLLVEGAGLGAVESSPAPEVLPASPASEAEQKEQASGDIRERSLKSDAPLSGTKSQILELAPATTTAPCPVALPATPPNGFLPHEYLAFNGSMNLRVPTAGYLPVTLQAPYVLAENNSNTCPGCTYFGTRLWKSKLGGGVNNTAFGQSALYETNCGSRNTAMGYQALNKNISGSGNSAVGANALSANVSGFQNTAIGTGALGRNTTGGNNVAVGYSAGFDQFTGSNNVYIDNPGQNGESNTIRIGHQASYPPATAAFSHTRVFVAGINTASVTGTPVEIFLGDVPQLGIRPSSRRYKEDIHDLGKASEGLQRLRPVSFRYKPDAVAGGGAQDYGLIAEEVAEVYPELVGRNADGEIITVHYNKLIPMLLNELQQQQTQIQRQQRKNAELEARLAKLESK